MVLLNLLKKFLLMLIGHARKVLKHKVPKCKVTKQKLPTCKVPTFKVCQAMWQSDPISKLYKEQSLPGI